jgi:hypothetical protein
MALLLRIVVIFAGFLLASLAAAVVVIGAVLYPELSGVELNLDESTARIIVSLGFIFVSGFALLPALVMALITEAFALRSILVYAVSGAVVGGACYLSLTPWDPATMHFQGLDRRELEVMIGAGVVAGLVYWLVAGRRAGLWRGEAAVR